jgi:hypothetical protein
MNVVKSVKALAGLTGTTIDIMTQEIGLNLSQDYR